MDVWMCVDVCGYVWMCVDVCGCVDVHITAEQTRSVSSDQYVITRYMPL